MKRLLLFFIFAFSLQGVIAQCGTFTMSYLLDDPTCYQFSDGSITIQVQGQTGNVTYVITDSLGNVVNTGNSSFGLPEGWYYLYATDEQPCTLVDSVYLDGPDEMMIQLTVQDVQCFGETSGYAVVDTVENTTGDYNQVSYFWSPDPSSVSGVGGDSSYALAAGPYTLVVFDDNGCSQSTNFDLTEPDELYFTSLGMEPCTDSTGGIVYASAGGGTPNYSYNWYDVNSAGSSSNTTWGGLQPSCYYIEIYDANNCFITDTLCLSCLSVDESYISFEIYPNPSQGIIHLKDVPNGKSQLIVYNLSGQIVYTEDFTYKNTTDLQHLSPGTYLLQMHTELGIGRQIVVIN